MFQEMNKNATSSIILLFSRISEKITEISNKLNSLDGQTIKTVDNSYKIMRVKAGQSPSIEGNNVSVLNIPDGNFQVRFQSDGDWIKASELYRGDTLDLKVEIIEVQGDIKQPITFYIGQ